MKKKPVILTIILIIVFLLVPNCHKTYTYAVDMESFNFNADTVKDIELSLLEGGYSQSDFSIRNLTFYINSLPLLIDINRIAAFINIKNGVTNKPIIDLTIIDNSGQEVTLLTGTPFNIDENAEWNDKKIKVNDIKEYLQYNVKLIHPLLKISGKDILNKYFTFNFFLKDEYKAPGGEFIYALLKKGFYVYTDCLTGALRVVPLAESGFPPAERTSGELIYGRRGLD